MVHHRRGRKVVERFTIGKVRYTKESHMCGKPGCTTCPHGPYYHAYFAAEDGQKLLGEEGKFVNLNSRRGGRTRQVELYIGKTFFQVGSEEFNRVRRERRAKRKERAAERTGKVKLGDWCSSEADRGKL